MTTSSGAIPSIDPPEAARRLAEAAEAGPLIVDVRERDEFATVRIPGAVLLPLSELQESYARLPQDRPLILQCASGKRSLVAAEFLRRQGYADVANLDGGIVAWKREGLPTLTGGPSPGKGEPPER